MLEEYFIALIHPIQWTIANPVGAVLCTRKVAHRTSFLSRQSDIIASFLFGTCTVQTCFQHLQSFKGKSVHYDRFSTLFGNI